MASAASVSQLSATGPASTSRSRGDRGGGLGSSRSSRSSSSSVNIGVASSRGRSEGNGSMTAGETTGGATYAVVDHRRQTREGIAVTDVDDDFDFDETTVGDVEQENSRRRRRRRRREVVVDSREEEAAGTAATATSRDSRGSGTGRSHVEEGLTSKEDSVLTSSNIFDLREDKDEERGEEEGGGVVLDGETHHPRDRFSRRGRDDDSMCSSSSGSGGGGRGSGGRGRGSGGDTTGAPCFVTHGYGARERTTTASAAAVAANGVRGEERVGGRVDGGNAVAVGGGGGGVSGLYEDDGSDCSSYGSTLTLGRPEPSSVHWKYSRRLLQT